MAYFLGVDGGGTQTTCLLGDDKHVLASATVDGSNLLRVGSEKAQASLQEAILAVCAAAGVEPGQIAAICAGIAGAARHQVRERVLRILAEVISGKIDVVGDMVVAHYAALDGAPGIVINAGTGSIAYGRTASGRVARAGGWGPAISDEGSGHWIGVQAVAAVIHVSDSGSHTKLNDHVFEAWQLASFEELTTCVNAAPLPNFAALFPAVLAAAKEGDSCARDILTRAGVELAKLAEIVFHRLWKAGDVIDVAMSGGVLANSDLTRNSFERAMQHAVPQAHITSFTGRPAEGALALARELANAAG